MAGPARWRWGEPIGPLEEVLGQGGVLAIPSESSYGLAADPRDPRSVAAIYRIKGRPAASPLPVVAAEIDQLRALGVRLEEAERLGLTALWPAPLTLVLPLAAELPAAAGSGSLGVRIPAHPPLRELLSSLGRPLTATSANRSGEPPVLEPGELEALLADEVAIVVDDGPLAGGAPSTLVAVRPHGVEVLRRGGYPLERLPFSAAPVEIPVDESS